MIAEINVADIYVSITGSLLMHINICWRRGNCQDSMPDHPDFTNTSMRNYKGEILLTVILEKNYMSPVH